MDRIIVIEANAEAAYILSGVVGTKGAEISKSRLTGTYP